MFRLLCILGVSLFFSRLNAVAYPIILNTLGGSRDVTAWREVRVSLSQALPSPRLQLKTERRNSDYPYQTADYRKWRGGRVGWENGRGIEVASETAPGPEEEKQGAALGVHTDTGAEGRTGCPQWLQWCCVSADLEEQVRSRGGSPMKTGSYLLWAVLWKLTHVSMCTILSCDWAFSITFKQVALLMKELSENRVLEFPIEFSFLPLKNSLSFSNLPICPSHSNSFLPLSGPSPASVILLSYLFFS